MGKQTVGPYKTFQAAKRRIAVLEAELDEISTTKHSLFCRECHSWISRDTIHSHEHSPNWRDRAEAAEAKWNNLPIVIKGVSFNRLQELLELEVQLAALVEGMKSIRDYFGPDEWSPAMRKIAAEILSSGTSPSLMRRPHSSTHLRISAVVIRETRRSKWGETCNPLIVISSLSFSSSSFSSL